MIDQGTFAERLLAWFDRSGRKHLPWQQQISPYRVWISEIMLQQTQVNTVIPYFERFMHRFPTVESLAAAAIDEVMHLWTGLGYYARARNLHRTAVVIASERQGVFPSTVAELCLLPGIGRSTAGAIVSIAMRGRAPILDGNVTRVIARCYGVEGWPGRTPVKSALWQLADQLTPTDRVPDYTQAIMDLGATLCTRTAPDCANCPFEGDCVARQTDAIERLPGKRPTRIQPIRASCLLVIQNKAGELLLQKRPPHGVWGGLWSFPECAAESVDAEIERLAPGAQRLESTPLVPFRHTFTHFHLDITPVHATLPTTATMVQEPDACCWYSRQQPAAIGLTRPVTRMIQMLGQP
jgi:A/G-specific adenine glycosylase